MEGEGEGEEQASKRVLEWRRGPCRLVPYVQQQLLRAREDLHYRGNNESLGFGSRSKDHKMEERDAKDHRGGLDVGEVRCLFHGDGH